MSDSLSSTPPSKSHSSESNNNLVTPDAFHSDWVKDPTDSDVLCGRGGSINSHIGNERFRQLVEKRKRVYLTARFKREKRLIASSIVSEIRGLSPPGRFLSKDTKSGMWKDIGDEKARDKTSQALRENAPSIRAEIETEINEQRAEIHQKEEEAAARVGTANGVTASHHSHHQHTAVPPPPPPSYYPWGYPNYYGYAAHNPPPGHYPPPPPPPQYDWNSHYTAAQQQYPSHHAHPPQNKSALEATADMVASSAESIKNWTVSTLGGGNSIAPSHSNEDNRSLSSKDSRPIVYVHGGERKKRRMVKFQDHPEKVARRSSSNMYSRATSGNSIMDGSHVNNDDVEPQSINEPEAELSLMNQFANHVLGSLGSWDASTLCGTEANDTVPFPRSQPSQSHQAQYPSHYHYHDEAAEQELPEEDMAVEWEGQEVQLVDRQEFESVGSDERMPPPVVRPRPVPDQASSIGGFSSLGSCHSWLPDQISGAASFFSGSRGNNGYHNSHQQHYNETSGILNNHSMDYDHSTMEGSLGGNSLTRVFDGEHAASPHGGAGGGGQRSISQVPSWDRSFRSRSPLSVGSGEDEDFSLISKTSSKVSASSQPYYRDDMVWDKQE